MISRVPEQMPSRQCSHMFCCCVCVGDEILELNGESLHGLTHDEALHKFKVRHLRYDPNSSLSLKSGLFYDRNNAEVFI